MYVKSATKYSQHCNCNESYKVHAVLRCIPTSQCLPEWLQLYSTLLRKTEILEIFFFCVCVCAFVVAGVSVGGINVVAYSVVVVVLFIVLMLHSSLWGEFGSPYLGKATAAARAALLISTKACSISVFPTEWLPVLGIFKCTRLYTGAVQI